MVAPRHQGYTQTWHHRVRMDKSLPLKLTNLGFEGSESCRSSQASTVGSNHDPTVQIEAGGRFESPQAPTRQRFGSARDSPAPTRAVLNLRCTPRAATWLDLSRPFKEVDPTVHDLIP
ncbi:hypothetical protein V6N13_073818 [Hibiscus sabdariffa]